MAASVSDKDNGWKTLRKTLAKLGDVELVVGIPGEIDFSIPTQGAIGTVHEFGSVDGKIESRSFIRSTFDANVEKYGKALERMIGVAVKKGAQPASALFQFGEQVRSDVVKRIKSGEIRQELAESTINAFVPNTQTRRGDGHALVNTGTMVGSIVAIVRKSR